MFLAKVDRANVIWVPIQNRRTRPNPVVLPQFSWTTKTFLGHAANAREISSF